MATKQQASELLRSTGFDPDYVEEFESKLFYEGPKLAQRLTNFATLLLLAATIATFGLIGASAASVIGAMIVAPLMGPIMATTAAVVMGNARRAAASLVMVFLGVTAVIILSWLLTFIVPDIQISFVENPELASRISPGLMALLTALASGAAGAFITARREIADSIGGVAIAISLVPPLCVVGIALNQGEWAAAAGSLTLFVTNFLAILLAGGLTFLILGLGRLTVQSEQVRMRRNAFIMIVIATIIIAIPLAITSTQVIRNRIEVQASSEVVSGWLAGSSYETLRLTVNADNVDVMIAGEGAVNTVADLANALAARLGRPVAVNVRTIPSLIANSSAATGE